MQLSLSGRSCVITEPSLTEERKIELATNSADRYKGNEDKDVIKSGDELVCPWIQRSCQDKVTRP